MRIDNLKSFVYVRPLLFTFPPEFNSVLMANIQAIPAVRAVHFIGTRLYHQTMIAPSFLHHIFSACNHRNSLWSGKNPKNWRNNDNLWYNVIDVPCFERSYPHESTTPWPYTRFKTGFASANRHFSLDFNSRSPLIVWVFLLTTALRYGRHGFHPYHFILIF